MRSLLALLALAPFAHAQKEFGFDNRKPSGQPYRSPADTVAGFTVPPEFEVRLFAGEPQVVNPVAFSIDEKGRVWVLECFEYPSRTPKGKAPRDRIVILEDTDGDGACDKRTVFAEGKDFPVTPERAKAGLPAFDLATGLEVGHGAVWVGAPPYLWRIEVKDDKPARFETVAGGFGSQDTHETLNTFQWGPDGWLYGMQGVFTQSTVKPLDGPELRMNAAVWRLHPTTKKFEVYAEGTSNPWGMDWRNTDGQFILACCVIPHLYHIVPGGIYKRQAGASYNPHAYEHIQEISDHTFHRESGWAHAGLLSLDVPHMPERFRNSVIFGSIHGCSLKQNVLKPNGSSYTASRGDDFLQSADKNVRPINLRWGPHGDIYLIDWHDQNPCHQAAADSWDYARGRVYRIQLKGRKGGRAEDMGRLSPAGLVDLLADADPYRVRTALRLLGELPTDALPTALERLRQRQGTTPLVTQVMAHIKLFLGDPRPGSSDPPAAMRSALDGAKELSADAIALVFRFIAAVQVRSDPMPAGGAQGLATVAERMPQPAVQRELASVAVRLADKNDIAPLLHALMSRAENANDPLIPHLTWLAYEKVLARGGKPAESKVSTAAADRSPVDAELAWLAEQSPKNVFVRDRIVPKAMRRLAADHLERCLKFVADSSDRFTREKALDGLAVALADKAVSPPGNWPALRDALLADQLLSPYADRLAVAFRDKTVVQRAEAVFRDRKGATPARRAEAVRQIARLEGNDARDFLLTVVNREGDERVRTEAARMLGTLSAPQVAADVLAVWKAANPPLPRPVRAELMNALAGRKEWARALLAAVKAGTVDRTELSDNHVTRMQALRDREVNDLIAAAWGRTRPTPKELEATLAQMRDELGKGTGSFAKGKAVFAAQCGKCHQFDGAGANVGPPLDGAGRDIEYILANVIDPNRVIGAPYFQRIVTLQDGRVEQGVLAEEDDQSISLKTENGVVKRFPKADLDGPVKVVERSLMPEGLAAGMTVQDFRDLVVYLMASPFPGTVTVNGEPVPVPVSGLIPLPKGSADKPVVVTYKLTAASPLTTRVTVGSVDPYTVAVDGQVVGEGKGAGRWVPADTDGYPVTLSPGEHTVTLTVRWKGTLPGVYLRVLDPDRKLVRP